MTRLLVVDVEPNVLALEGVLPPGELEVLTARTPGDGIEAVRLHQPDVVVLDVCQFDLSALETLELIHALDPRLPVIVTTAAESSRLAIEVMKRGAFDYAVKPLHPEAFCALVREAVALSRQRHTAAAPAGAVALPADGIVGDSRAMREVCKRIGRVARQDVAVLVRGESGTGKELVARTVHQHSKRAGGEFVAINCAAIPDNLIESELFGHERGAFTGADHRRLGKFEQASGGTLFLDEIGDMPVAAQPKLLRLLQEQRFERVGGTQTIQVDVRVLAATNQDLEALAEQGRFRPDLYHRLNDYPLRLPPLREHPEDIPSLVQHFLQLLNPSFGKQVDHVSAAALRVLTAYPWPGNVRELQSAVKCALVEATGGTLIAAWLPAAVRQGQSAGVAAPPAAAHPLEDVTPEISRLVTQLLEDGRKNIYHEVLGRAEQAVIATVLQYAYDNEVRASNLLGISRSTLRAKLKRQREEHWA